MILPLISLSLSVSPLSLCVFILFYVTHLNSPLPPVNLFLLLFFFLHTFLSYLSFFILYFLHRTASLFSPPAFTVYFSVLTLSLSQISLTWFGAFVCAIVISGRFNYQSSRWGSWHVQPNYHRLHKLTQCWRIRHRQAAVHTHTRTYTCDTHKHVTSMSQQVRHRQT